MPRDRTRSSRRCDLHRLFSQIPRSVHQSRPLSQRPSVSEFFLEFTNIFQVCRYESPLPEFKESIMDGVSQLLRHALCVRQQLAHGRSLPIRVMYQFGAVEGGGFDDSPEVFRFSPELVYD